MMTSTKNDLYGPPAPGLRFGPCEQRSCGLSEDKVNLVRSTFYYFSEQLTLISTQMQVLANVANLQVKRESTQLSVDRFFFNVCLSPQCKGCRQPLITRSYVGRQGDRR